MAENSAAERPGARKPPVLHLHSRSLGMRRTCRSLYRSPAPQVQALWALRGPGQVEVGPLVTGCWPRGLGLIEEALQRPAEWYPGGAMTPMPCGSPVFLRPRQARQQPFRHGTMTARPLGCSLGLGVAGMACRAAHPGESSEPTISCCTRRHRLNPRSHGLRTAAFKGKSPAKGDRRREAFLQAQICHSTNSLVTIWDCLSKMMSKLCPPAPGHQPHTYRAPRLQAPSFGRDLAQPAAQTDTLRCLALTYSLDLNQQQ